MKNAIYSVGCLIFAVSGLFSQSGGGIQGTIKDDSANAVAGAYAVATPIGLSGGQTYTAVTDANGAYNLKGLQAAKYSICIQAPGTGNLDPCEWATPFQALISLGQTVANQALSVTKGSLLQVRISDPNKLSPSGGGPDEVLLGVILPSSLFHHLRVASKDSTGTTYDSAIPFNIPVRLSVTSAHLVLVGQNGASLAPKSVGIGSTAIAASSGTISITSPAGQSTSLTTLTITARQ